MKTDAKVENEPVVGETLMAVNVDVVATTGYRAPKLLKSDIYNDKGEKTGKLDDFIVVSEEKVSVAIVAVGGFLGMGKRMVAVPAGLLESNAQGKVVLPGATKDRLKALAAFQSHRDAAQLRFLRDMQVCSITG
jgi:sporulation protein YlmC with PRC-barrel domain